MPEIDIERLKRALPDIDVDKLRKSMPEITLERLKQALPNVDFEKLKDMVPDVGMLYSSKSAQVGKMAHDIKEEKGWMALKGMISVQTLITAFIVATIVYAIRTGRPSGRFLRIPYDFRMPTLQRLKERMWNPDDPRIFTPLAFGIGWTLNLYQVFRKFKADQTEEPIVGK